jgi:hypothetical protein
MVPRLTAHYEEAIEHGHLARAIAADDWPKA